MSQEKEVVELKFTMMAEVLPNNARTDEIMKKRAEEEEVRRAKKEEIRLMKEKEEKSKK